LRPSGSDTDYVMYEQGLKLRPAAGANVLGTVTEPFFNRNWEKFCSHAHSPAREATSQPAALHAGKIVVFAHPIFTTYGKHSMSFHRDFVLDALKRLLPVPLLTVPGPTSLQATLTKQGDRHIVHLLHYVPERRGLRFDIVEDRMPVLDTTVRARVPAKSATLVPSGVSIPVTSEGDVSVFTVPAFLGKQMIALETA
jgi:hypothetical protein